MSATLTTGSPTREFALGALSTSEGRTVSGLRLRYRVLGNTEAAAENGWILVFHALTGSAEVDAWWGPLVGPGKALDTTRHAIVAANLLGSCYGSSGPTEWKAEMGETFPELSPADLARSHIPLLEHLGIRRLALATGGSLGGMVALEWGRLSSVPTDRLVVFAAPGAASPQAIGWNAVQRMAIEADPAWAGGKYAAGAGPVAGLAAARALAMITYRSGAEFQARFGRLSSRSKDVFDVEHYLRRQGDKLVARFDAASYAVLMRTMDLHDIGDFTAAARDTAARVGQVIGVGIDSDILYLPAEVRDWVAAYRGAGVNAEYREIASLYGHDAFLIEWNQVERILRG
ncbi:MAG TPA: homoserine O-acetyltransferase [Gemmatimonadales bacterium]|nr:homoserine O-acetyltransferase [Gemmatimonadales bacterium]